MRSDYRYMLFVGITMGFLILLQQSRILKSPANVDGFAAMIRTCGEIADTSAAPVPMLTDILGIPGDVDEFGEQSRFPAPSSVIRKLIANGRFGNSTAPPFYAVNFGARDGKGTRGNTDPTWELFKNMGFHGLAVEADGVHWTKLNKNFKGLPVNRTLTTIFPENAVAIIEAKRLPRVDVLKIDIDSWDCAVLPPVVSKFRPSVAIVEYNLYFPPPIKMALHMPVSEYNHHRRSKVYECSLQYQNDDVMAPLGYTLVQVDWQNALYLRNDAHDAFASLAVAGGIGLGPGTVDVQAAYQQGYVQQPKRSKHIPWASDVVHFIALRDYSKMMLAVVEWFRTPKPRGKQQRGGALLGCGARLLPITEQ